MRISKHGQTAPSAPQDAELLRVCARFHALDAKLDRLVALDDPPERDFIRLHAQWMDVLAQALTLPAHTIEGQQAKDTVFKKAMAVMLGTLLASGPADGGRRGGMQA